MCTCSHFHYMLFTACMFVSDVCQQSHVMICPCMYKPNGYGSSPPKIYEELLVSEITFWAILVASHCFFSCYIFLIFLSAMYCVFFSTFLVLENHESKNCRSQSMVRDNNILDCVALSCCFYGAVQRLLEQLLNLFLRCYSLLQYLGCTCSSGYGSTIEVSAQPPILNYH